MYRYIAFAWNKQNAARNSLAKTLVRRLNSTLPEWKCVLATEGLQVYHVGERVRCSQAYVLDQNAGVVLGKIFERRIDFDCDPHEVVFNRQETQRVRDTQGRHLIDHYWGRYVALLREDGGVKVRVLRDPTGAIPCLLTKFRGIVVVCSHIDDGATLGLINGEINWNHVAAYLWHNRLISKDTGLDGVQQIQAGACIVIGSSENSISNTFYWSPGQLHNARVVEDRHQAMRELRGVIQHCVKAWASCYSCILHELSGGLDSAVVLACLSEESSDTNVVCINYFTRTAQGDERSYAQKAASRAGVELIEAPLCSSARAIETMFGTEKVATPTYTILEIEALSLREQLVKARGIEAVFSGQGGDHFFQQLGTPLIAADYVWRNGLRAELLRVIADTSHLTRTSVWSVMAAAITSGILHRHEDPYDHLESPRILSEETRNAFDLSCIRHYWVDNAKRLPGSKLLQVHAIVDSQNFYRVPCNYADIVHPLISQPIIELCLQIPSYVLTYGGRDRTLVRDAFSDMVPPDIVWRKVKGGTTTYFNELLVRNLPFLREFLLDGTLVTERILDRKKTEASLRESELIRDPFLRRPLLDAVRAEAWLRTWIGEPRRVAA